MRKLALAVALALVLAPVRSRGQSQHDMHVAADEDARAAELELARVERELRRYLDEDGECELDIADRAFQRYRDAETAFEAGRYHGGSMEPMVACQERAALTWARARGLRATLEEMKATCVPRDR